MGKEKINIYVLDVRVPKKDANRIQITEQMTIGSDPSCDIHIPDHNLAPLQGRFRYQNEVLTLTQFGPEENAKLGRQKLKPGKMYIIDKGDKISFFDIKIIIRMEKVLKEELEEEEYEEIDVDEDSTDPNINPLDEIPEDDEEYEYVEEEVVYVEEADEEDEKKPKGPGLFAKLKGLFKRKKKKEEKEDKKTPVLPRGVKRPEIKVKKGKKIHAPVPGFLIRLIALLFEAIWTVGIATFVLEELKLTKEFSKYQAKVQNLIVPHMTKGWNFLLTEIKNLKLPIEAEYFNQANTFFLNNVTSATIWKFGLIFIIIGLISNLVFATSLPLFFLGVGEKGNFLFSRIKAIIRFPLGILLAPFLIFDLPCLIKKRTLKEVLTFSRLYTRNKVLPILGSFLILPLITIAMFMFPLGLDFNSYLAKVEVGPLTPIKKSKKSAINKEFTYVSNALNLKSKSEINKYWYVLPEMKRNKKDFLFSLKMVDTKKSKTLQVTKLKFKKIKNLKSFAENPFLHIKSQELVEYLEKKKEYSFLNKELISLAKSSLGLSLPELHLFIIEQGIMVKPYMDLRKQILDYIKLVEVSNVEHFNFLRQEWLSITNKRNQFLLTINNENFKGWKLEGKSLKLMGPKAISSLFGNAKVLKESEVNDLNQIETYDAFNFLDTLQVISEMGNIRPEISSKSIKFFMQLSLEAIQTDNEFLQKEITRTLKALDKVLISLHKTHSEPAIDDFRIGLNRLNKALNEKDIKFLELNLQGSKTSSKKNKSKKKKSGKSKSKKRK